MQGEEEFKRNIPYPLFPTNIAGAFTSPPPPDDLDLEHATPETLIAHGQLGVYLNRVRPEILPREGDRS